jgi:hypothetical protein
MVVCVVFSSKLMIHSKPCWNTSNNKLLLLQEFTCDYWLSIVKILWTKYCASLGEKSGLEQLVAVWEASHHNSRFEQARCQWCYTRQAMKIKPEIMWRPEKLKDQNIHVYQEKKLKILKHNNTRPHISAPNSAVIRELHIQICSTPSLQPGFGTISLLVFTALKKHLKWIYFTRDEDMVARTAWRILHKKVQETCSVLATYHYVKKWGTETKYTWAS